MSIIETRFMGYASLASGQTGVCRAGYTFAGDSSQEVVFQKNLVAPYEDNYSMLAGVGVESFTQCGKNTAILNVNSEVRINPVTSPNKGLMTVSAPIKMKIMWRRCASSSSSSSSSQESSTVGSGSQDTTTVYVGEGNFWDDEDDEVEY